MDDNRKKLYDALSKDYDMGTFDQFCKDIQDDGKRRKLYEATSNEYDYGSFDSFSKQLAGTQQKPQQQPVAAAPAASQPQQKAAPAKVQPKNDGRLTAAERQAMLGNVGGILAQANAGVQRAQNRMDYAKANTGLQVPRVKLGDKDGGVKLGQNSKVVVKKPEFNAQSGKPEQTYITESGNEYTSRGEADLEQNAIDEYKDSMTVSGQLRDAYAERDRLDEAMKKRMKEIDNRPHQRFNDFMREAAAASTPAAGPAGVLDARMSKYDNDDEYMQLMAAARKNRQTIQLLEDKKNKRMNSFWHSFGTTALNGYTFTDGMGEMRDATALQQASRHIGSINRKRAEGKALTREEETAEAVLKNFATDNAVQGVYGGDYGAWARAGSMGATSIDFMRPLLLMNPSAGFIAKGIMRGTAKGMAKGLAKVTGKEAAQLWKNNIIRRTLKATGVLIGAHTAGAYISNTAGIGQTAAVMGTLASGEVGVDDKGNYKIENAMGLLPAFVEAERQQARENGSEMFGEFIPGVGGAVKKGLEKIGLSKLSGAMTNIGNKEWYRQYSSLLKAGGYNGLPGEALEEYEGSLFDALTGHAGDAWDDMTSMRNHVDIWLGCATMGALLGAVPMMAHGYHTAQYYRYKRGTANADRVASWRLTEERWKPLREKIDGADNGHMADVVTDIIGDKGLDTVEKKAALEYVRNLTRMRGYNIAQVNNAGDEEDQRPEVRSVNDSYANGYDTAAPTTMDEAKNLLGGRRRDVARMYGINEEDVDAMIGDDPLGFIDKQRRQGATDDELQTVMDYANAKAAVDGMAQRVQDDAADAAEGKRMEVQANVERHTHKDLGMVQPATMKVDDKQVYIVKGNVVVFPDGSGVDARNSDQSIVVCDAETGEYKFVSPDQLLNVGEAIDPQSEIGEAFANIQAEHDAVLGGMVNEENVPNSGESVQETPESVQNEGENAHYSVNEESLEGEHGSSPEEVKGNMRRYAEATAAFLNGEIGEIGYLKALDYNDGWLTGEATVEEIAHEARAQAGDFSRFLRRGTAQEDATGEAEQGEAAEQPTALERVPVDENTGEPMFERVDKETALDALNEVTGGNEANTTAIVNAQVEQAKKTLDALKKKQPRKKTPTLKGSPMAMVKAQQEADANYNAAMEQYNAQVAAAEEKLGAWSRIYSLMNDRKRAVREQREAEQRERDRLAHDAAVAQLEEDKRIAAEKAAEQAEVGTHAVNPKIKAKWDGAAKVEGNANAITLADGSNIRGHYVLTEAGTASASHDVNNAFEPTEGFPIDENGESVNDRDYKRDTDAQRIVRDIADNYDSRALQSPVIVSKDGIVLSGNNRTMSGDIAAQQGTDKAYIDHLREFGQMYGFTPEQIDGMKHPRVVFVPDEALPYDATTFARFNAEQQKKQGKDAQAVKLGKVVPDNVFTSITNDISRFDRLSDYYADDKAVSSAISQLLGAGVINEMQLPELRTGNTLSAAGRELIENTLIGKVFQTSPDAVRQIIGTPTLRHAVMMGLNEIAHNRTLAKSSYDLSGELGAAVDLVARAKASDAEIYKEGMPVSPFGRQQGLFDDEYGDSRVTDGVTLLLADVLNSGKPSDLRKVLATYNNEADAPAGGQLDMFSGKVTSKEELLNHVIEYFRNATPREQKAIVDAAIAERKQRAEANGEVEDAVGRSGNDAANTADGNTENVGDGRQDGTDETDTDKVTPIGESDFGFVYDQFKGNAQGAIRQLMKMQDGEALGALHHDEIGDIDLVWGKAGTRKSDGYGLAKLVKFHPEVLDNLQGILDGMHITKRSENRVQLEDDEYQAAVRLTWNGEEKLWLLTAFKKKETSEPTNSRTDVDSNLDGKSDDTATRQSSDVSVDKDINNQSTLQGKEEKSSENKGVTPLSEKIATASAEVNTEPTEALNEDISQKTERIAKEAKAEREKNGGEIKTDSQGNPINADGTLKLEKIASVDELTDEDFSAPTRNVELPELPKNVNDAIGADDKPVVIKKNIFEKNWNAHKFPFGESRVILKAALYDTDLVGQTQPTKRPLHWVAIKIDDKSPLVVLEVNKNKDNVEIVGWYTLDGRNLERIKRQAEKNGGDLVMLSPRDKVESLSTPLDGLSSEDKGTAKKRVKQGKGQKSENTKAEKKKPEMVEIDFDNTMSKPSGLKVGKSGKNAIDVFQFIEHKKDELKIRPIFGGVHYENGVAVATDGHVLVAITTDYDKENEGKTLDKSGVSITGQTFPKWGTYMPRTGERVDKDAFLQAVEEAKAAVDELKKLSKEYKGRKKADKNAEFNSVEQAQAVEIMDLGHVFIAVPSTDGDVMIWYDAAVKLLDVIRKAQDTELFLGKLNTGLNSLVVTGKGVYSLAAPSYVDEYMTVGKFFHVGGKNTTAPRLQKVDGEAEGFAEKHGVEVSDVEAYENAMKQGNVQSAHWALGNIRRTMRIKNRALKLSEFKDVFAEVRNELYERFGNLDELQREYEEKVLAERNVMEAARKKAEEEAAERQKHLDELSLLSDEVIDKRYMDAIDKGDETAAREMLDEAARRKGYADAESDYQGEGAWSAPSNPGYESDEARRADVEDNAPDVNLEDMALGYTLQPDDYFTHPERYAQDTPHGRESTKAIRDALDALKRGEKDVKVKVYRAVPTSVKEGKLRNGDWVTPSRKYADMHGNSRLEGKYRIIEDEVPAKDLWWDGNDANEFGYDNGKRYRYKNTKNNRKLNDLVTRDDKGNVILPSKRFNSRKADERYHRGGKTAPVSKNERVLRDALDEHLRNSGMEVIGTDEGQRVLDAANGEDVRKMSFGEPYDYEKYPLGRVEPGIADKDVNVVDADANHGFANYKEAKEWAKGNISKTYNNEETGGKGNVRISNAAIDKFMSQSAINKSDGKDVHMAVLKVLPEVLKESIDVETHPDFLKGENGKRSSENGINKDVLVHRCYGAVNVDGKPYRVKITLKENVKTRETTNAYSYEATKIELLAGQHGDVTMTSPRNSNNSITGAKLLKDVEMSYNPGVKVLDESKKRSEKIRNHKVYHGSGAYFDHFDHSHMGEGEGAQAYGWGTYVTEVEGIGRHYAKVGFLSAENKKMEEDDPIVLAVGEIIEREKQNRQVVPFEQRKVSAISELETYVKSIEEALAKETDAEDIAFYKKELARSKASLDILKPMTEKQYVDERLRQERMRHLYTAEIPDDNGSNYLQWNRLYKDDVLYSLLNKIGKALEAKGVDLNKDYNQKASWNTWIERLKIDGEAWTPNVATGEEIYEKLSKMLGENAYQENQEKASQILADAGFTGIKYPADYMRGGREDGKKNYVIFNEEDAKITDHVRFFRTADGEAYGFTVGGKIYYDPRIATSETLVHEYAHLWASALRGGNAGEWKNVVGLMKGTSVWDEVKRLYPELETDDEIADEVIAQYSGRRGAERLREEARKIAEGNGNVFEKAEAISALEKVKRALAKFWKGVCDMLHIHYTSAEEVADRVMKDLLDGVDPRKFGKTDGRLKHQFVGERGAEAADRAEEVTTRLDNLGVAGEMEEAKKDAKAIKMATGWERGADGKWRYEIPDIEYVPTGDADLNHRVEMQPWGKEYVSLTDRMIDGETLTDAEMKRFEELAEKAEDVGKLYKEQDKKSLADYVRADELFKAYPNLRAVNVEFMNKNASAGGSYSEKENTIYVNENSELPLKEVFAHEIQHAIQHIEGFARGGSVEVFDAAKRTIANVRKAVDEGLDKAARLRDVPTINEWLSSLDGETLRSLMAERLEARQRKNFPLSYVYLDHAGYSTADRELLVAKLDKANELIAEQEKIFGGKRDWDSYALYKSLAGEVESRNVQKRMGMTDEQRRASLASETEDVSREDQIFLFGEGGESHMGSRTDKRMAEIGEHYEGKGMSDEQRAVVDVFSGKRDRQTVTFTGKDGKEHQMVMIQGQDSKAGSKHAIYRHYGNKPGWFDADDLPHINDVVQHGEEKREMRGKTRLNVYRLDIDGVKYTVLTEVKKGKEIFNDFYTNRKASSFGTSNTSEEAHTSNDNAFNAAKVVENFEKPKVSAENVKFRLLEDDDPKAQELESLPDSELVPVYRNVQAFEDDALGSPMAFTDAETGERRELQGQKWNYSNPPEVKLTEEQQRQLDELNKNGYIVVDGKKTMELQINDGLKFVKPKTKEAQLQYFLKKNPEDKGLWAAYDPYDHAIETPLNTQFGEAYKRPNLVVVRSLIPKSEIDEPFKADYALLPTGAHQWNNGRTLYLSRWSKIDKVLTREEEAKLIDEYWKKSPGKREALKSHRDYNRFVPQVRRELEKMGYRFELDGKELSPEESLALDEQNWESRDVIPGREGNVPFVSNEDIKRINAKMAGKWVGEPKEAMENAMTDRVNELAERLHTPVRIIRTDEEVAALPSARQRRMKGSFNPMTGEVTIVVPNNANLADVENTFVHEVVGHDGLRVLFPEEEKLAGALDELYRVSNEGIRQTIDRMAQKMYDAEVDRLREKKRKEHEAKGEDSNAAYYADMAEAHAEASKKREQFKRDATEEYGADLAGRIGEKGFEKMSAEELTFWGKLKAMLQKALARLLEGLQIPGKRKWSDKDWAFVLHEAYKRKKNGGKPDVFDAADTEVMRRKTGYGETKFNDGKKKADEPKPIGHSTFGSVYNQFKGKVLQAVKFLTNHKSGDLLGVFHRKDIGDIDMVWGDDGGGLCHILNKHINEKDFPTVKDLVSRIEDIVNNGKVDFSNGDKMVLKKDGYVVTIRRNVREKGIKIADKNWVLTAYNKDAPANTKAPADGTHGSTAVAPGTSSDAKVSTLSEINEFPDENVADEDIMFRDGDSVDYEKALARDVYERRVSRGMYQMQEALQDSMLGLKEAMDAILKAEGGTYTGMMEDVAGYENAYLGENRLSSVNQAETEAFARTLFKPMLEEVAKLAKTADERADLTDYMMAKHGLERNDVMARRAAAKQADKEFEADIRKAERKAAKDPADQDAQDALDDVRQRRDDREQELYLENRGSDYAGLTALTGTDNVADAEAEARRMVWDYEHQHDIDHINGLWDSVDAVNKATLLKTYESGLISREVYNDIKGMYKNYIPLRGFDDKTSGEAYAYLSDKRSAFNSPIKTAKGRKSKADDPLANMEAMAESAIMQGNRNMLVKQRFLNFALNHPSDLVSVSDLWLWHNDAADEWQPVKSGDIAGTEAIEEDDSAAEVERKTREFEEAMRQAAKSDPDHFKKQKDAPEIPYRVVESRDLHQHQVLVKRNGRDIILTINGNPRAAQALNGQTNPDNDTSGAIGAILHMGEAVNRQLSAWYTTRNPDFVVSNFVRDLLYSNTMVWVKESPNYAIRYHKNVAKLNPARMKMLLAKLRNGTLDMNNETEKMFYQFIMNGGETGYANIRDIEQRKNDIRRELKTMNGKMPLRKGWKLLGERLDEYNRAVESCARFAAFMTSRQMKRSIDRSIYDAKEISVNFNKKGSGAKFMGATGQTRLGNAAAFTSGLGRSFYVFWNAAIQGTTNFGRQAKRHPAKAMAGAASMFVLGALMAAIGGDDGDDGEKNAYYNLPDYVRRSNIVFRLPGMDKSWISLPLPVEYRAMYGMGELAVSAMSGKCHYTDAELAHEMASQVSQMLPIDVLEGGGGWKAFVPSAVKPLAEVWTNESWTGMPIYRKHEYNENMPEWTKAYKSANGYLVGLSEALNEATGGDAYTKGKIDINPAKVEYLLNGYFGGLSRSVDEMTKMGETVFGDREYDPKSFMLLNRLVKRGDERTEYRAVNNEYFRIKEASEDLRRRLNHYEDDTMDGVFDYAEKIAWLNSSPEYRILDKYEEYSGDIDAINEELKDKTLRDDKRKALEAELNETKKELVDAVNAIRDGKQQ